jgi:hypothetical protein
MTSEYPFSLDNPAEFLGEWWLHNEPEQRATGRLTNDPDCGLLLDAMGGTTNAPLGGSRWPTAGAGTGTGARTDRKRGRKAYSTRRTSSQKGEHSA